MQYHLHHFSQNKCISPGVLLLAMALSGSCFQARSYGNFLVSIYQEVSKVKTLVFSGSKKTVNHLSSQCLIWGPDLLLYPYNGKKELETFHLIICQQDQSKFWKAQPALINKIKFSDQFLFHLYMENKYLFLQMKCVNKDSFIMMIMIICNSHSVHALCIVTFKI